MESGDHLLHIPTCASPTHGLLGLRNQFLFASQIQKHRSFGGGTIFIWPLNKPQAPVRSYPIEAIGPRSCTEDGVYLASGASSGNAYVWEVLSGRMLKSWRAHHKSVNCVAFTADNSFLISGSDDGSICIWSMIRCGRLWKRAFTLSFLVRARVLYNRYGINSRKFKLCTNSSSMDVKCKVLVWDIVSGRLLQTLYFSQSISAMSLHPEGQLLFLGSLGGRIFVNRLDIGLEVNSNIISSDQLIVLNGHK